MRERIAALDALQRKYGTGEEEVLAFLARAAESLDVLAGVEQARERAALEVSERVERVTASRRRSRTVATARCRSSPRPCRRSSRSSGWRGPRSRSRSSPTRSCSTGAEHAEFVFSGGPSQPAQPLAKVASGGELSRTMLACRSVLVDLDDVPTLIFDEVDAGIGGRAGVAVGRRLANLALGRQVVVVTHLPQIASFADRHIRVRKDGGTASVEVLDDADRVEELSRMLAGLPGSDAAAAHAAELLTEAGRSRERSPSLRPAAHRMHPGAPTASPIRFPARGPAASVSPALAWAERSPGRGSTRRRPRSGRNRGACSGVRFGDRSRRPASHVWMRGPSGWFSACSRVRSR